MSGFVVLQPGMLSLIQDAGRYGKHNIGLTNGGPVDKDAFCWANKLLNNPLNSSTIEISIGGLALEAQVKTRIAFSGADMPIKINGTEVERWRSHNIASGDQIEIGFAENGLRGYLAVAGGFTVAQTFSSSATVLREKIGGLNGDKLSKGDVLPCESSEHGNNQMLEQRYQPSYENKVTLRTIPGYQQQHFSSAMQRLFFSQEFEVSERCDRMGYRLLGDKVESDIDGILSEGICHGAVQIPADGQPIVLLNDRQTIGGYPKIGSVIGLDTGKLSQLGQGGSVHFEPISIEAAHNLQHLQAHFFENTPLLECD